MNPRKTWIIVAIIAILVIIIALVASNKKTMESDTTVTTPPVEVSNTSTTGTKGTTTTKTTTSTTPLAARTLKLASPVGGEQYKTGAILNIDWDASEDLANATLAITLIKNGQQVAMITGKEGVSVGAGSFKWEVPDLSLWQQEGFSVKLATTNLSKNISVQSGSFTVVK